MITSDDCTFNYKTMFLENDAYLIEYHENPNNPEEIFGLFRYCSSDKMSLEKTFSFSKEELKELENAFRLTIIKESKKEKDVNFILFLCSLSYIGYLGLIVSMFTNGSTHQMTFISSYLTMFLPQLVSLIMFNESFPMFGPKKLIKRKKDAKKLRLFLQYEKEIQDELKRLNENNMNPYDFDGNIKNIRNASYDEIISLTKRIK